MSEEGIDDVADSVWPASGPIELRCPSSDCQPCPTTLVGSGRCGRDPINREFPFSAPTFGRFDLDQEVDDLLGERADRISPPPFWMDGQFPTTNRDHRQRFGHEECGATPLSMTRSSCVSSPQRELSRRSRSCTAVLANRLRRSDGSTTPIGDDAQVERGHKHRGSSRPSISSERVDPQRSPETGSGSENGGATVVPGADPRSAGEAFRRFDELKHDRRWVERPEVGVLRAGSVDVALGVVDDESEGPRIGISRVDLYRSGERRLR